MLFCSWWNCFAIIYEDKNDASMQMLMFKDSFLPISNALYDFYLFAPDLDEVQNLLPPSFAWTKWKCIITIPQPRLQEKHKTAMRLLTNQSCNPSEQTVDFIIFLISSSFIWIICWLLSFLPVLSSWCGKTHQESISRPGPCVSQSKSGASSSSPSLQAELFTTHWCGGWPAVLLVNYSYPLPS